MHELPPHIQDKIVVGPDTKCWFWMGATHKLGYGQVRQGKTMKQAHRVVYETLVGPIPPNLECDHLCRIRCCVNPDHIELVTHRENILRGDNFMARRARQTHCIRGHEFSKENTIIRPDGNRKCKACQRAAEERYKHRNPGRKHG